MYLYYGTFSHFGNNNTKTVLELGFLELFVINLCLFFIVKFVFPNYLYNTIS